MGCGLKQQQGHKQKNNSAVNRVNFLMDHPRARWRAPVASSNEENGRASQETVVRRQLTILLEKEARKASSAARIGHPISRLVGFIPSAGGGSV